MSTVALDAVVDAREFKLRFEPVDADDDPHPGAEWDVRFTGTAVTTGAKTTTTMEARELGYVPFATFAALVFAAPLAWRRRRTILLGGLLLLGARLALAIGLPVAHYVGTVTPGSAVDLVGRAIFGALIEPPDMMYAAPVVVFLLGYFLTIPRAAPAAAPASPPPAVPASPASP